MGGYSIFHREAKEIEFSWVQRSQDGSRVDISVLLAPIGFGSLPVKPGFLNAELIYQIELYIAFLIYYSNGSELNCFVAIPDGLSTLSILDS